MSNEQQPLFYSSLMSVNGEKIKGEIPIIVENMKLLARYCNLDTIPWISKSLLLKIKPNVNINSLPVGYVKHHYFGHGPFPVKLIKLNVKMHVQTRHFFAINESDMVDITIDQTLGDVFGISLSIPSHLKVTNYKEITLQFSVGNTHKKIENIDPLSNNHSTTLFVQSEHENSIERVEYEFPYSLNREKVIKNIPPFQTSPVSSYGPFTVKVNVFFVNDTKKEILYDLNFQESRNTKSFSHSTSESIFKMDQHPFVDIPKLTFGIELELMVNDPSVSVKSMIKYLNNRNVNINKNDKNAWKIMSDNSIQCSPMMKNCLTFELVSPIFEGDFGLYEIGSTISIISSLKNISVNSSSAFHVHIDPKMGNKLMNIDLIALKNISKSWMKYEEAFELLISQSRLNNKYCQSNRKLRSKMTDKEINQFIDNEIQDLDDLITFICGDSRYVKFNLYSLKKHGTIEFRLHQGTYEKEKIQHWIRLLLLFVKNSMDGTGSQNVFSVTTTPEAKFKNLFDVIIKDRKLFHYYSKRKEELKKNQCDHQCDCKECKK
jgi:hypothetical protein